MQEQEEIKKEEPGYLLDQHDNQKKAVIDPKLFTEDMKDLVQQAKANNDKRKANKNYLSQETEKLPICHIILYKNGFHFIREEFREFSKPQNQKFIQELKQGYVPEEIRPFYPEGLQIRLEDRSNQQYSEQQNSTDPNFFKVKPNDTSNKSKPKNNYQYNPKSQIKEMKQMQAQILTDFTNIQIDYSQPTAQVQIQYYNGQLQTIIINANEKVSRVYDLIQKNSKINKQFQMLAGFPPKPITNLELTIEQADLMDSKIIQKLC